MRLDLDDAELERLAERLAPIVARLLPPSEPASNRLLSLADVAKLIGSTRKALEMRFCRARQRGEFHELERMAIHVDGVRRWREADVNAWIEAYRRGRQK